MKLEPINPNRNHSVVILIVERYREGLDGIYRYTDTSVSNAIDYFTKEVLQPRGDSFTISVLTSDSDVMFEREMII